jgi:hypothetical protein
VGREASLTDGRLVSSRRRYRRRINSWATVIRALVILAALGLTSVALPARAGMRLTLVMVDQEQGEALSRDPHGVEKLLLRKGSEVRLEMDKEWHGIHFLLNGDRWSTNGPYGQVVLGGREIGPDMGYGPARLLSAEEVAQIASRLSTLSPNVPRQRYDPAAMTRLGVYPEIWERDGQDALEWLLTGYRQLVDFYVGASAAHKAVVLATLRSLAHFRFRSQTNF